MGRLGRFGLSDGSVVCFTQAPQSNWSVERFLEAVHGGGSGRLQSRAVKAAPRWVGSSWLQAVMFPGQQGGIRLARTCCALLDKSLLLGAKVAGRRPEAHDLLACVAKPCGIHGGPAGAMVSRHGQAPCQEPFALA